ncbi:GPW/gp25 family protein [Tumebacillus flagellatus]|uniref:IraD/Gp25-like domain-containing protein n=1 Tax=Tumebacillus flagellatus TaxID=1157490 RepID=A0A074LW06_9BACL|nr:GPW/gp25 family protein [Tumebacillus flagellatus]KEO84750.1 hypothetical protein EL26_01705 [Tumebacillus flagellatus]
MYEVIGGQPLPVKFGAVGIEEIKQNVYTALTTAQGSVPLDRGFGLNMENLDDPLPLAKARLTTQVVAVVQKQEPRVIVESVTFAGDDAAGQLVPVVKFRLRDGVIV